MKKLLLLILLISFIGCESKQKNNPKPVQSIKIGNLEVALTDLGRFTWHDATDECSKLGDGWRLPTKDELIIIYQNKDKIGGFEVGYYWSSTEINENDAYTQFFSPGSAESEPSYSAKIYNNSVRAVRSF